MPRLPTWEPSSYPEPAVRVLHEDFQRYRVLHAGVDRIATGFRWAEGPVWFGDMRCLLWSDIPNNRIMKWDEETETVSVFRRPSNFANGNTRDHVGRLITCEHGTRRVTRTEHDGTVTVIADGYDGRPLNSPNDVVVKSDGAVWFTDPAFGIAGDYEGHPAEAQLPTNVYRIDPESGAATVVAGDIAAPNGLAFSPDESVLYVVQSLAAPPNILAFDVVESGTALANGRVFIDAGRGRPDGLRCDQDGNLWCGWGLGDPDLDGVMVFRPDGERIGHIQLPERCANLTFGGPRRNRLFMAASRSIYALYVNTRGLG
jgi:gluconolactonase